jgi:hypothetical protein
MLGGTTIRCSGVREVRIWDELFGSISFLTDDDQIKK